MLINNIFTKFDYNKLCKTNLISIVVATQTTTVTETNQTDTNVAVCATFSL